MEKTGKNKAILIAMGVAAIVIVAAVVGMGFLNGVPNGQSANSQGTPHRGFNRGNWTGYPGNWTGRPGGARYPGNWTGPGRFGGPEFANNTQVQTLFRQLMDARRANETAKIANITGQLQALGVNMSRGFGRPPGSRNFTRGGGPGNQSFSPGSLN